MGGKSQASKVARLEHPMRKLALMVDVVPALVVVEQSLLSGSRFADVNYISIYNKNKVNIHNALTTQLTVLKKTVFKGWMCPITKCWQIPLKPTI